MKNLAKTAFGMFLGLLARGVVHKYKPKIVMITGSVGKTSTKDATAVALKGFAHVRASEKSYNSEIGVPLTIFGVKNPWLDPIGWLKVLKTALALLLLPNHYPKMLVIEVGADRPGDMRRLMRVVTPDALIVTRLPEVPVHVEAYASPAAVREEEFLPAYHLPPEAPLIICAEDHYAREMSARVPARVYKYGHGEDADLRISEASFLEEGGAVRGMCAMLTAGSERARLEVLGSVGRIQVLPAAAAAAAAMTLGGTLAGAVEALREYTPPAGRGRLLVGLQGSVIIDDSYNASPAAVEEALTTLKAFPRAKRRIAILGDMLELGRYSAAEHERIGTRAAETADIVVSIGIRARKVAEAARTAGLAEDAVFSYDDSIGASMVLKGFVQEGDVVLIKGSQSIRTERLVEELLANPEDARLLVRQERQWKRR